MDIKILKAQKSSNRSIWNTKLSIDGIINGKDNVPASEQAYELVVDIFAYEHADTPLRTIDIDPEYYAQNVQKYGMSALLKGVELTSVLSVTEDPGRGFLLDFEREAEAIAYSVVAKMEQQTFFNNYNPNNMRDYIEQKILELKDKFKIDSK